MFSIISLLSILTFSSAQLICEPGTYFRHHDNSCVPCIAGYFVPIRGAIGSLACIACPPDTYSNVEGASKCTPCPEGEISSFGSTFCGVCPFGNYLDNFNECRPCINGFTSKPNQRQCTLCPAGFAASQGSTSPDQCIKCPPDMGPDRKLGECKPCFGTKDDVTANECESCPLGSIPDFNGGKAGCSLCLPGDRGGIQQARRSTAKQCTRCLEGTTTFSFGSTECVTPGRPCRENTFRTSLGDCLSCDPDYFVDKTTSPEKCSRCPKEHGSAGGTVEKCEPCVSILRKRIELSRCFYRPRSDDGTEQDVVAVDVNGNCPAGTKKKTRYPWACEKCGRNKFSTELNSEECQVCPFNTWTEKQLGQSKCTPCPEGFFSDRKSVV